MGFFEDLARKAFDTYSANKDNEDTLKTLVFVVGHKAALDRELKKSIASMMKILDEDFSLYSNESEINAAYNKVQNSSLENFFSDILSLRIDRTKIANIYIMDLSFVLVLRRMGIFQPQYIYNLYLIRKHFNLSRQELAACYRALANMQNQEVDFDDFAEEIEDLTGDEAVSELVQKIPELAEENSQNYFDDDDDENFDDSDEEDDDFDDDEEDIDDSDDEEEDDDDESFDDSDNEEDDDNDDDSEDEDADESGEQNESSENDVINQLERLAVLKEKGILTDEEFAQRKAKILGKGSNESESAKTVSSAKKPNKTSTDGKKTDWYLNSSKVQIFKDLQNFYKENSSMRNRFMLASSNPAKLEGVLSSYGALEKGEEPILLYDDTVMGGAKDGFLITNKNVYTHEMFATSYKKIPLREIKTIKIGLTSISFNSINAPFNLVDSKAEIEKLLKKWIIAEIRI